jgi:hypothetical protein
MSLLLASSFCLKLFPPFFFQVLCARPSEKCADVLAKMAAERVLSVPVFASDDSPHCNAFFDLQDFLCLLFDGKDVEKTTIR